MSIMFYIIVAVRPVCGVGVMGDNKVKKKRNHNDENIFSQFLLASIWQKPNQR